MANVTVTFTITEFCLHTGISEEELTIADARRDLHIQRFRDFLFDHAKGVINRQVIADGTLMLSKRFFEEYRHFDFNIVAACGGALTALAGMLTEN